MGGWRIDAGAKERGEASACHDLLPSPGGCTALLKIHKWLGHAAEWNSWNGCVHSSFSKQQQQQALTDDEPPPSLAPEEACLLAWPPRSPTKSIDAITAPLRERRV